MYLYKKLVKINKQYTNGCFRVGTKVNRPFGTVWLLNVCQLATPLLLWTHKLHNYICSLCYTYGSESCGEKKNFWPWPWVIYTSDTNSNRMSCYKSSYKVAIHKADYM